MLACGLTSQCQHSVLAMSSSGPSRLAKACQFCLTATPEDGAELEEKRGD